MNREDVLFAWRAAAGNWAQFMKPSLLVQELGNESVAAVTPADTSWAPFDGHTALIVELPARESICVGAALGDAGWCLVPIFNTTRAATREVLATAGIVSSLWGAAARGLPKAPRGPPAFLLDADRQQSKDGGVRDGDFDNRWYVFRGDFPSVELFMKRGIARLQLVARGTSVESDLSDALARHRMIAPSIVSPDSGVATPMPSPRHVVFRALDGFGRALARDNGTFGHVHTVSQG